MDVVLLISVLLMAGILVLDVLLVPLGQCGHLALVLVIQIAEEFVIAVSLVSQFSLVSVSLIPELIIKPLGGLIHIATIVFVLSPELSLILGIQSINLLLVSLIQMANELLMLSNCHIQPLLILSRLLVTFTCPFLQVFLVLLVSVSLLLIKLVQVRLVCLVDPVHFGLEGSLVLCVSVVQLAHGIQVGRVRPCLFGSSLLKLLLKGVVVTHELVTLRCVLV